MSKHKQLFKSFAQIKEKSFKYSAQQANHPFEDMCSSF